MATTNHNFRIKNGLEVGGTVIVTSEGVMTIPTNSTGSTQDGGTNNTSLATTAFVQQELTSLIGGAPNALDTLNELAAAINDDSNYNTTLTTALATKLPLAGGTLTGSLSITATNSTEIDITGSAAGNIRANADLYLLSQTGSLNLGAGGSNSRLVINTSGNVTTTGSITSPSTVQGKSVKVNTPDEGNAPALTAVVDLFGYEGRGAGINIRDKVNSATNASNREWFIGSGYNQSGFNIGYSSTGTQTSYTAQNKLSIDTSGNVTAAGTVTATGGNSTNWNTAYGWGDHASGGYSDEYKNYSAASGADHDTHHWNKTHAAYSNNGSSPTYIVLTTNVPQDSYSMGGFTLIFQNHYSDNDEGDVVNVYGYWNAESNSGFVGFRYHATNPDCNPTIEVGRNSAGKTVFIISGDSGNYAQVIAKDLYLGYSAASANSSWGDSWAFSEASTLSAYSNRNTLNRTGLSATQVSNWNTAYTYSQVGHLPLAGGTLTGALSSTDITATGNLIVNSSNATSKYLRINSGTGDSGVLWELSDVLKFQNKISGNDLAWYSYELSSFAFLMYGSGQFSAKNGYEVNGTTVIDASRNISAGTLTSGAITASESSATSTALTLGSSSQTSFTKADWKTSEHGAGVAYIIAYGAGHSGQAGNFAIKNVAAGKNIFFELASGVEPLRLTSTGATFAGTITSSGKLQINQAGTGTSNSNVSPVAVFSGQSQGGTVNALSLVNSVTGANNNGVSIGFHNANVWSPTGTITTRQEATGTNTDSRMVFQTYRGALHDALVLDHDQNAIVFGHMYAEGGNITAGTTSTDSSVKVFHSDGTYSVQKGWGMEFARDASYLRPNTDDARTMYFGASTLRWDQIRLYTSSLKMGEVEFLDASRNASFNTISSGAISSGAITSTGTSSFNNFQLSDSSRMGFGTVKAGATVGHTATADEGIFWHTGNNYGIYRTAGTWASPNYPYLRVQFDTGIKLDGGAAGAHGNSGVDIVGSSDLQMAGTTVIDASRNISAGTITSGAITSTGTLQLDGAFAIDTDSGNQPLCINRLTTSTASTQSLRINVDDNSAVFVSEQDETGRYGGYQFRAKHGSTTLTRYGIDYASGDSIWYNDSGTAKMLWDASEARLGVNTTSPATTLDVNGGVTASTAVIYSGTDGKLVLRESTTGTVPWNYMEFRNSSNDRNAYFGTNNGDQIQIYGETGMSLLYTNLNFEAAGTISAGADVKLNGDTNKYAAAVYKKTVSGVNNSTWTTAFTVTGASLGSTIRATFVGTAGSVVVNTTADIMVGHYQDILIQTKNLFYTILTIKVTSDNNEDFAVDLKINHVNAVSLAVEVFPQNSETVAFPSSHGYGSATHTHTGKYGQSTTSGGGNSGDLHNAGHITTDGDIRLAGGGIVEAPSVSGGEDLTLRAAGQVTVDIDSNANGGDNQFFLVRKHTDTDLFYVAETGHTNIQIGNLKMGGTSVIDSSRNIYAAAITASSIVSSDNVAFGNSGNISMDSSANGQVEIKGSGYQGAIALNASGMHIYHNSSARSLVLGTNETARMTISGSGTFDFHARSLTNIGAITTQGALLLTVSDTDSAHQRVDVRDETGDQSRAHWYGVNATGGTANFRHAWYDGNSYINVTAASNKVTFSGSLAATSRIQAGAYTSSDASVIAQTGDIQLRIGSISINHSPYVRFQGSASGNNVYGDIQLDTTNQKLVFKDPGTTSSNIGQNPMALDSSGNLEVSGDITGPKINLEGGAYEGSIVFGTDNSWHSGIRQHDDGHAEMRIWHKNSNGRIYIATGYDGEPSSISKPNDGLLVRGNRLGIGNFSSVLPDRKLHVKTTDDATIKLDGDTSQWAGIEWRDINGSSYQWYNGSTETWSLGGGGSSSNSEKRLHVEGGVSIGANLKNTTVAVNGLNVEGNVTSLATLVGANVSAGGVYNYDSSGHLRLLHPAGAAFKTGQSTVTGAIKIVLPVSWTSTMMRMTIKVYEYATGESFTIDCGGYNYQGNSSWINTFAYITGQGGTDRNFTVRFGHDGSKCCIYIGELNSTWSYPQLSVTDFQAGFNSTTSGTWRSGWDISFESSAFGTVTRTHTETDNGRYHRDITINGGNLSLRNNTDGDGAIIRDIEFLTTAAPSTDDRSVIIRALNQSGGTSTRGGKLELLTRKTDGQFNYTTIDSTGALTVQGLSTLESGLQTNNSQLRVKISPWTGTTYGIGMKSGMTFGGLNNYAMTFQMDSTANRGWWWGTNVHTDAQGAMALTNAGKLSVASNTRIGMGYTDTAAPSGGMLEVGGGVVVHAGTVWDETTQGAGKGSIHLDPALSTDDAGGAITWGASDTSNGTTGQAGIYVRSNSNYGTRMYLSTTDSYATGSKTALYIDTVGNVSITRGSLVATGNVTAYSDIKLKRDILEIQDALAIVQKIRGVTYERIDKDDGLRHCGVIAQEVEAAGLPEVVRYDEENDVKTVDYGNMVALCIQAIKEQQDQIDAQKEQINQLTNLVNALMEK